jgi:hypothetical protein
MRAAVALVLLAGCSLYFDHSGGGGDDACLGPPAQELRDPTTGQCQAFGGGCGINDPLVPDWATCGGACEGLDQTSCGLTAGCREIFADTCPTCNAPFLVYAACWETAPSSTQTGDCYGLDAQGCSERDDCAAVHLGIETAGGDGGFTNSIGNFEYCQPEQSPGPFACGTETCTAGQYCETTYGGVANTPPSYACADYPQGCNAGDANAQCACLTNAGVCATACSIDAAGDLTSNCYLP